MLSLDWTGVISGYQLIDMGQKRAVPTGRLRRLLSSIHMLIPASMYEGEVTNGVPAGAIVSPMTTTAHRPKTSKIVH